MRLRLHALRPILAVTIVALVYLAVSLVLGLGAALLGLRLGHRLRPTPELGAEE